MALSRPVILAILGVLLCAAALVATRSMGTPTGPEEVTAPPPTAAAKTPSAPTAGKTTATPAAAGKTAADPSAAKKRRVRESAGLPPAVARAIKRRRVVVLFFGQKKAAEDAVTRSSIRALRRRKLAVFTDTVERLPRYGRVVSGLGVSQAPATVVIDRNRSARLVEGFQDEGSLRQYVRDARR